MKVGELIIDTKIDTKDFTKQIEQTQKELEALRKRLDETRNMKAFKGQADDVKLLELEVEKTTNKLVGLYKQQSKIDENRFKKSGGLLNAMGKKISELTKGLASMAKNGINKVRDGFKNAGKSASSIGDKVKDSTKKLGKMALAIFGIRAAYGLVRNAVSEVTQDNEQLQASINTIKSSLANALAPAINFIVDLLKKALAYANAFVKALTGKDLLKKTASSAAKTNKELQGSLASWDEINVLNKNDSSGAGGDVTDTTDYDALIDKTGFLYQELMKIKDLLASGDWGGLGTLLSEDIGKAFDTLSNKIKSINWSNIGKQINKFLTNIDFSRIFTSLVGVFGEAVVAFQDLMLAIDWGTILANYSQGLIDAINLMIEYINQIKWEEVGNALSNAFTSINWAGIGNSILNMLWSGLSGIVKLFLSIDWGQVGKTISDAVKSWIETIITKFRETDWGQLGMDIANAIMDFILNVDWAGLGISLLEGLVEGIIAGISFVLTAFSQMLDRILEFFGVHSPSTVFADLGKNLILGLVEGLKSMFAKVISAFTTLWNNIKSGASKGWEDIKKVFEPTVKFFSDIFDGIYSGFKGFVNLIIKGINLLIKGINKISFDVPDWVPGIGGKKWGFNIPEIPKLATGGIITAPTMAMMGENHKKEAVLPLEQNTEWMDTLAEKIANIIGVQSGGETPVVINFNGSLAQMARIMKPELDKENSRVGTRLVIGGNS